MSETTKPTRFRSPLSVAGVAIVLASLLPGCGGDGGAPAGEDTGGGAVQGSTDEATRTFSDEDFDITFRYPEELDVADDVAFEGTTGSPDASAGARLGREDYFAVQRFALNTEITSENLDQFVPEADAVYRELAGEEVSAEQTEVGGLPALRYEFGADRAGGGSTQAVLIFDGADEYLLTCKSTEAHRDVIDAACETAVETLEPTG